MMKVLWALVGALLVIGIAGNVLNYQRRVADTKRVEEAQKAWDAAYQKGRKEANEEYRQTLLRMNLSPDEHPAR